MTTTAAPVTAEDCLRKADAALAAATENPGSPSNGTRPAIAREYVRMASILRGVPDPAGAEPQSDRFRVGTE